MFESYGSPIWIIGSPCVSLCQCWCFNWTQRFGARDIQWSQFREMGSRLELVEFPNQMMVFAMKNHRFPHEKAKFTSFLPGFYTIHNPQPQGFSKSPRSRSTRSIRQRRKLRTLLQVRKSMDLAMDLAMDQWWFQVHQKWLLFFIRIVGIRKWWFLMIEDWSMVCRVAGNP